MTTNDIRERIAAAREVGATAIAVEIEWVTKTEDRARRLLEEIEMTRRALGGRFCVSHRDVGQLKTHEAAAAAIADLTEAEGEISQLVWERDAARAEVARLTAERADMIAAQEIRARAIRQQTARAQKFCLAAAKLRYALSRLYDAMPDCDGGEAGEACRLARQALKDTGPEGSLTDLPSNLRPSARAQEAAAEVDRLIARIDAALAATGAGGVHD